jgi:hypothetical protein
LSLYRARALADQIPLGSIKRDCRVDNVKRPVEEIADILQVLDAQIIHSLTLDREGVTIIRCLKLGGQDAGIPSSIPVFIVEMPRSRSTLIEQILARHPDVYGAASLTCSSRRPTLSVKSQPVLVLFQTWHPGCRMRFSGLERA